jgi:VIT1/CCC1 family predicted Fe2+/Mn2+ transporter
MSHQQQTVSDAVLSPFERGSEIIFGILMAISVTAAAEITTGGGADVRELMIAALGCNLAWGLIDGVIYLLQLQFERHRVHRMVLELRELKADDAFRARVAAELPPLVAQAMTADSFSHIRRAVQSYAQARPAYWSRQEFAAAGLICALVFASTFPLVLPFMVMQEPQLALRASHAIAVAMLFVLGWKLGRWSGASPLGSGALLALVGVVLAVLCVALGG